MLLPIIPRSKPVIASQPTEAKSSQSQNMAEEDKDESVEFEDFILWFQAQSTNVETPSPPEMDMNFETPAVSTEQESLAFIGAKVEQLVEPTREVAQQFVTTEELVSSPSETTSLFTAAPIVKQPSPEVTEEQPSVDGEVIEVFESMVESGVDVETATDSLSNPKLFSQAEIGTTASHAEVVKALDPALASSIETGPTDQTNNFEVTLSSPMMTQVVETSFNDVVKVASQPAQSVTQQVAEQTLAQIANSSGNEESQLTVRLDPPELGEVLVSIKKSEGGILMRVAAIEKSTQALLQLNEIDLAQSMADQNTEVTMEFGSQSDFQNERFENSGSNESMTGGRLGRKSTTTRTATLSTPLPEQSVHNFTA